MQPPHVAQWQNLPGSPPDADHWRQCEPAGFREAEELLDLLERAGIVEREFHLVEARLVVRWRPPALGTAPTHDSSKVNSPGDP